MMKAVSIMAVVAFVTLFTRVLPFVLFGGKKGMPKMIGYLGKVLPAAIIAALVVYCFKELTIQPALQKLWSLAAGAAVILLHLWKRNTLLSIAAEQCCICSSYGYKSRNGWNKCSSFLC